MAENFKTLFGIDFAVEEIDSRSLPVYLSARRSFFRLSWAGNDFILVKVSTKEKFGVIAFEKQAVIISEKYGMPVTFEFENLSRAQRDSLIEKNIPFISDAGQLYLPFLGMALSNRFTKPKEIRSEKMMPATQALFLYMLYRSGGKPVIKKDAAEALGVTRTSITRASDQLSDMGLISQEMRGKEYYMSVTENGKALYEKARPYLINPVQKSVIISESDLHKGFHFSGESALAKCTMLNPPAIPVYAVYKADVDPDKLHEIDIRWEPEEKVIQLELWKYDPNLFANDGIVDPVSLSMCFEENVDERIEGSLEDYLEEYEW